MDSGLFHYDMTAKYSNVAEVQPSASETFEKGDNTCKCLVCQSMFDVDCMLDSIAPVC